MKYWGCFKAFQAYEINKNIISSSCICSYNWTDTLILKYTFRSCIDFTNICMTDNGLLLWEAFPQVTLQHTVLFIKHITCELSVWAIWKYFDKYRNDNVIFIFPMFFIKLLALRNTLQLWNYKKSRIRSTNYIFVFFNSACILEIGKYTTDKKYNTLPRKYLYHNLHSCKSWWQCTTNSII